MEKDLGITEVRGAKANIGDLVVFLFYPLTSWHNSIIVIL